ncbi:MAG: S-adenosylmethionine decarboxylase [Candidatus Omnitrophica bacterium]|nr:S-adenosylmethionine decarboxylase [Candidatus Omnitrophota bacterium]MDD5080677.1 S-adenosylmethionine decarboxylase [Candidatus Omnitrophota bacterium]MDD5440666.1 S-adenosylmethionine decarboxylase [Candidatus Omnitrophota bacterium]
MNKNNKNKSFGYELIINLYDCDIEPISSKEKLKQYVDELCDLIEMVKYGETLLPYFGENEEHTKGYSLVQLIETSSITGHFSEYWKSAYINIFSCKTFDKEKALEYTTNFFKAKETTHSFLER